MNDSGMTRLLKTDLFDVSIKKFIERLKQHDKIILWGVGGIGFKDFKLFLQKYKLELNILYYADNNPDLQGTLKDGLKIFSPEEIIADIDKFSAYYFIIVSQNIQIKKQLLDIGISKNNIDVQAVELTYNATLFSKQTPFEIIQENKKEIEQVYHLLSDDYSKEVYISILNNKISLDNIYLSKIFQSQKTQSQIIQQNVQYHIKHLTNQHFRVFHDCTQWVQR